MAARQNESQNGTSNPTSYDDALQYHCDACKDAGWVHPVDHRGQPYYDKVIPCRQCGGPKPTREALSQVSGIRNAPSFDDFNVDAKGTADAFNAAYDFAKGELGVPWLVIYGTTGNGKTHLAKAVGNYAVNRGTLVRYFYVPRLISEIKKGMNPQQYHSTLSEQLVDECCSCGLLILDDLGAQHDTKWTYAQIEEILNQRYEAMAPTMVTTNVLGGLDGKGQKVNAIPSTIVSRFKDTRVCKAVLNTGSDYRPKMRAA